MKDFYRNDYKFPVNKKWISFIQLTKKRMVIYSILDIS